MPPAVEKDYKKNPMVTFKIADDEDEDETTADTQLLAAPMYHSPHDTDNSTSRV